MSDDTALIATLRDIGKDALEELTKTKADARRYRLLRDRKLLYLGPIVGERRGVGGQRYILTAAHIGAVPKYVETLDAALDAIDRAKG